MFLKRFYDEGLAQASYLIGCAKTGEALVIDANRDIQQYLDAVAAEKLRITHVTETHIHADYVSGSRELVHATGAQLFLSAEGGKDWQYGFAAADGATLLRDSDQFKVGYAHDFTTTALRSYQSGTHELMLSYDFRFSKGRTITPRYF